MIANQFTQSNIQILVNEQATRQAIEKAFEKLISQLEKGDLVYIHFSGHGQQITDVNSDELDKYDEAWVPYDAMRTYDAKGYHGQNHLADDVLESYFNRMRTKIGAEAQLIIVIDACHSGDGTRGDYSDGSQYVTRGVSDKFELPIANTNSQLHKKADRRSIQWVVISACDESQQNYESTKGYGSLSYALYELKNEILLKPTTQIFGMIKQRMSALSPNPYQTPCLEIPCKESQNIFFNQ